MNEWISVEDRLPHSDKTVLCTDVGSGRLFDANFLSTRGWVQLQGLQVKPTGMYVTHWMPLPEPPNE